MGCGPRPRSGGGPGGPRALPPPPSRPRPPPPPPPHTALFERLRQWRADTAKEQGVPAYVVFHDATLREIAARKPGDLPALGAVSGVGESKLARYGEQVLEVVTAD
ncbi:HRDC domain-containing protein [Nocardia carnea]|uniref:HRDC domain-containing protein n=1 Tax=Nocardia carnea TaxID=37328 RepID=UPI002457366F|nr:HRDC domain-containing protein [Nocardia carnea]